MAKSKLKPRKKSVVKPKYPLTVSPEMFEQWKKHYRHGDVKQIVEVSGFSKPTVQKAIKYGNTSNVYLMQHINNFFETRQKAELKRASVLKSEDNGK